MSVVSFLVGLLALGFLAVAVVGFLGWRGRMRDVATESVVPQDQRKAA